MNKEEKIEYLKSYQKKLVDFMVKDLNHDKKTKERLQKESNFILETIAELQK